MKRWEIRSEYLNFGTQVGLCIWQSEGGQPTRIRQAIRFDAIDSPKEVADRLRSYADDIEHRYAEKP